MKTIIFIVTLFAGSAAMAQSPPPPSFFRADGQPSDKVLLKASRDCHAHNPNPTDAEANCAVVDNQITSRSTETGVAPEVTKRATELAH